MILRGGWSRLHKTGNTTLLSIPLSWFSKRQISPQIPCQTCSFTKLFWYNWKQHRGRNSLSGRYHTVLPLPWLRSFCLLSLSLQAGSSNWLQRSKHTQNLLQPKILSLPINFSTPWKKKKESLSFRKTFFLSSVLTVARPQCKSSPSPVQNDAHPRYRMYI